MNPFEASSWAIRALLAALDESEDTARRLGALSAQIATASGLAPSHDDQPQVVEITLPGLTAAPRSNVEGPAEELVNGHPPIRDLTASSKSDDARSPSPPRDDTKRKNTRSKKRSRDGSKTKKVQEYFYSLYEQAIELEKDGMMLPPLETQESIANRLNTSKPTVSRVWQKLNPGAKKLLLASNDAPPKGTKSSQGKIEAWDDGLRNDDGD